MTDAQIYTSIAAGLALVSLGAVMRLVRRFLQHVEMKDEQFTKFLSNHMSHNTEAMQDAAAALRELAVEVRDLTGKTPEGE